MEKENNNIKEKMKTFKSYINEQVRWSGSLSDKLFDIGIGLSGLWLPMSSIIFKRIGLEENRATVFHVTDAEGYGGIKKMQGRKQSISAFFEMQNRYFSKGIQTTGGVIVELDANVSFPTPVLRLAVVLVVKEFRPIAVLLAPVVFASRAPSPTATF